MAVSKRWPLAVFIALACGFLPAAAQEAAAPEPGPTPDIPCEQRPYSILVTVNNVKDERGSITIELYDDVPEHFLRGFFKTGLVRVPATKGEVKACVAVPKAGRYALAVYHDRNDNTKFDKTWIGLPAEPYGTSNNPRFEMRAPRLDEAIFDVNGPLTPMTVTLRG